MSSLGLGIGLSFESYMYGGGAGIRLTAQTLAENSAAGTAIGTLSVVGGTGTYTFTLTNTAGSRFQVAGVNGVNLQAGAVATNAEAAQSHSITIHADNGAGSVFDLVTTIFITDVNEFTPVITSNGGGPTAAINVTENSTAVTTVVATDADVTSVVTYSITGGTDAAKFTINPTTGVLAFITPPNFEAPTDSNTDNVYQVIVRASDGTNTVSQTINVTVTDVNEFAPVITSNGGGSTASISQVEGGTGVTTVTATDADGTSAITYSIVGGLDAAKFTINSSSGVLAFASPPSFGSPTDSNLDNIYVVTVRASDGVFNTDQTISVTITAAAGSSVTDDDWAAWVAAA